MKAYTQQLTKEMEEVENKVLTTEKGYQDGGSLFSRVEISREQLVELESKCQLYFNNHALLFDGINPTTDDNLDNWICHPLQHPTTV